MRQRSGTESRGAESCRRHHCDRASRRQVRLDRKRRRVRRDVDGRLMKAKKRKPVAQARVSHLRNMTVDDFEEHIAKLVENSRRPEDRDTDEDLNGVQVKTLKPGQAEFSDGYYVTKGTTYGHNRWDKKDKSDSGVHIRDAKSRHPVWVFTGQHATLEVSEVEGGLA